VAIRTILDTDIGTDVDDCLALAVMLGSPELRLEGVTCVYGDVALRARMVRKLLRLAGRDDIPVMAGAERPLLGLRPVYWPGHEGVGLLEESDAQLAPTPEHAVDYIVRSVMESPGEMHLLAIGPLTNVAQAFLRESRLAENLAHLTIMGGAVRGPSSQHLWYAEHNIVCDPEAAHIVLSSGAPMTLVPLDVTTRTKIRIADVERVRSLGTSFHEAVARQVELYPRFAEAGETFLHDPLAVGVVIEPQLVDFVPLHVEVETHGRISTGMTLMSPAGGDGGVQVAIDVDVKAAEQFIVDRIASRGAVVAATTA
jgi:purine nucleosidase